MKIETIFVKELNSEVIFYIGKNKEDNFSIIDISNKQDLWFHANNISSCHVVAKMPDEITKKNTKYIIKLGALLCKNNTNKLKNQKNIEIIYTQIKNIEKTNIIGCVNVKNEKVIII